MYNPAVTISNQLLAEAIKSTASDIHFTPLTEHTDVYFRVQGKRKLHKQMALPQFHLLLAYYKFTSGMDIGEVRRPQNGTMTYKTRSADYSLRLSTLPLETKESLAIRILPQADEWTLEKLFLFPKQFNQLKKWTTKRSGLILLTGPTGSGKTTTLYALLEAILAEKPYQAITLEDPIEKDITDILQVQVNERAGITYQTGLKAVLRHDPDILMIGEIRDKHVARFAFEASLTGHLVLSTLHAKNAVGTIHRLLEMGLSPVEIQQSLIAVAALELIPIRVEQIKNRRAAILELLEGDHLEGILEGRKNELYPYQTFHHLRKKAFAYGFISEEVLNDAKE